MEELAVAAVPLSKALDETCLMAASRCVHAISAAIKACPCACHVLLAPAEPMQMSASFARAQQLISMYHTAYGVVAAVQVFRLREEEMIESGVTSTGMSFDEFVPWSLVGDTRHDLGTTAQVANAASCLVSLSPVRLPRCLPAVNGIMHVAGV